VSRENFRKYGNPDGPGTFSVAIAMPKFLLEKDNQIQVLLVSFFILLVVVPGFLYMHFKDDAIKDERGVLLENKMVFGRKLNEMMLQKNIPQIAAVTIEFQAVGARSQSEIDLMKKILRENEEIKELMPKAVSRNTQNMNLLPLVVILAHMMQVADIKNPAFKENLALILKLAPQHANMMVEVCNELNAANRMGASQKRITARNIKEVIEYSQHFI
jgi:translocation protein SEC63